MIARHLSPLGAALAMLCLLAWFVPSSSARPTGIEEQSISSSQSGPPFTIADFDGDARPDLATLEIEPSSTPNTRYWIAFQLSTGQRQVLGITAPSGGLRLTSRDVNGDDFLDVVVTTAWTNWPVAVLLNDGHGKFTASDPGAFPEAFSACGTTLGWATCEIRDVCAALFSRNYSGSCEQGASVAAPCMFNESYVLANRFDSLLSFADAFHGRAPPSFLLRF